MKTLRLLALALTFLTVNVAFAADEIHWTVTGPNSVTFDWRGTAAENTIGYGLTSGAYTTVTAKTPSPVPVSSRGPFWEAKLTGLTANTRYYYKIGTGAEKTFRTPPAPGSSNFSIYAQGNIGSSSTYFNTGAVQDIIANDLPSFVVGLGDLTLGNIDGKAAVDQHFNDVMVWSKEAAYMPVWGDMETISSDHESFKNYKGRFDLPNPQTSSGSPLAGGEDWYWFDYGNVRFITLPEPWTGAWADWDTKAGALMAGAQANSNIKFIVTLAHQPAYSSGSYTGLSTLKGILDKLGDTYSKYKLNISAHSNNYERTVPQHGVIHVTAGTGGADLVQDGTCLWKTCTKPDWSAFRAMHLGALKLRFTAAGIEGSFICGPAGGGVNDISCTEGSVVDKFVIGGPVISAVSAYNITQNYALIKWTLDQPSTGQVEFGTTTSYGQLSVKESSFNYSSHILPLRNLAPATQYHFRIRSTNQAGLETVSEDFTFTTTEAPDTIAPSVPTSLAANVISATQINISWSASTDNKAVSGYKVFRNGVQIATVTGTSYSDTGLAASTAYSYTVSAYDAAGNNCAQSISVSAKTAPLPDTTAPSVPTNLTATTISPTQINLSWAASTDNVGVTGYKVFRNGAQIATVTGNSYPDSGLAASTAYSYTVSSYDGAGNNSAQSISVSAKTTPLPDTTAPSVPTNLIATANSSSQITLSWAASTDSVGVTGYKVFRDGTQIATVTGTSYSNTGLAASTAYSYKVSAYDAAGNNSGISATVTATTSSVAPAPTNSGVLGYAASAGVTGGAGGKRIVVTNLNNDGAGSLRQAVQYTTGPRIVTFAPGLSGVIQLGGGGNYLYTNSGDLTVDGAGANITISGEPWMIYTSANKGVSNVIIKNLTFANTRATTNAITAYYGANKLLIDHCTFYNNTEGFNGQGIAVYNVTTSAPFVDNVTISWCRFDTPNKKSMLLGNMSQTFKFPTKISVHHNWFNGPTERNPRVTGSLVHMWNNLVNYGSVGVAASSLAEVLVENNIFEHNGGTAITPNYYNASSGLGEGPASSVNASGNLLLGSPLPAVSTVGTFPKSKINYTYTLEKADSTLKQRIIQGAGANKG